MVKFNFQYNFRIGPEALWFLGTTIAGAFLVEVGGRLLGVEGWPTLDTWQEWVSVASFGAVRTGVGALLALITGGGFQKPGVPGPDPQPPAG
jgi:hypothetical protein